MNTAPKPILIWGGGGHGHVVIDLLRDCGGWDIVGLIDSVHPAGSSVMGVPVLGEEQALAAQQAKGVEQLVVAIGQSEARATRLAQARSLGFQTPSLIHPSCIVAPSAQIGPACVLCAGTIVGALTTLGDGVILNTRTSVDHDNQIGDYAHIAPGALLCGSVQVGNETWIGAGSVIKDHVSIGNQVMVGAGSLVLKNVSDGETVYGVPATPRGKETTE